VRKLLPGRLLIPAALLVAAAAAALTWRLLRVSDLVLIGTGYAAQQTCSCLFISRRPLDSCKADLDRLAQLLVSVHPGHQQVTARALGLAHATSRYQAGFGCSLQD
jgi:hypothetical protein